MSRDRVEHFALGQLRVYAEQFGMSRLAEETGLSRDCLHKALSPNGNPRLSTLWALKEALGVEFRFSVAQPKLTEADEGP